MDPGICISEIRPCQCNSVRFFRLGEPLVRQLGIHLLFSPSYSPNLNLIERLWCFVRKQFLNSTRFDSFERFQGAIDDCLDNMATESQARGRHTIRPSIPML